MEFVGRRDDTEGVARVLVVEEAERKSVANNKALHKAERVPTRRIRLLKLALLHLLHTVQRDKYTRHTLAVVAPADKLQVEKLNNKAGSWVAESRPAYTLSFITSLYPGQYLHQYDIGHVNMCKTDGSIRIATNSR